MLSVADLYQLEMQRNALFNRYNNDLIALSGAQQDLSVNRGLSLDDNERSFLRMFRDFDAPFSGRGLETSGIRNRFRSQALADQQRTRDRIAQSFDRQAAQLDRSLFEAERGYQQSLSSNDAFRSAQRQALASQIRRVT